MIRKSKNKKNLIYPVAVIILIGIFIGSYFALFYSPYKFHGEGPIKIFWLDSNTIEDSISSENILAFKNTLEEEGIDFEMEEFHFDAMRITSKEALTEKGKEAMKMIDEYQPDLIYATDDNAQIYAAKNYANTDIPLVFSGMNKEPEDYGYDKAKNVAGVLEREDFIGAINTLQELYPNINKIAVISDDTPQWEDVMERMKNESHEIPGINFMVWHQFSYFENFKKSMLDYQDKVDAMMILYINGLKDNQENNIPISEIQKWRVKNNKLPEVSFWDFVVQEGVLSGYEVSFTEQGEAAAQIVKEVLIDGKKPSRIPFEQTTKGQRMINLKRAESLGLKNISNTFLENSKVYENYSWEK
jgi:ABC-type uncharacterized transport system substrate-binding protein